MPKFFLKKEEYDFWSSIKGKIFPQKNVSEEIEMECVNGVFQRVKKEKKTETSKSVLTSKDIMLIAGVAIVGVALLWYFKRMKR